MPARSRAVALLMLGIAALAGCAATRGPVDEAQAIEQLGFLRPGEITRTDVEARLGPPGQIYEGGRVVTYLLEERDGRLTALAHSRRSGYTLIIEYGPDGALARRGLVRRM